MLRHFFIVKKTRWKIYINLNYLAYNYVQNIRRQKFPELVIRSFMELNISSLNHFDTTRSSPSLYSYIVAASVSPMHFGLSIRVAHLVRIPAVNGLSESISVPFGFSPTLSIYLCIYRYNSGIAIFHLYRGKAVRRVGWVDKIFASSILRSLPV